MDVKSFLTQLVSALAKFDFVKDVDLKTESLIVSGRIILQKDMFLEVYYNGVTETIAFALIKDQRRIWRIDRDNVRDWHVHPLDDPTKHVGIDPLSVSDIVETLAKTWGELSS
ncbi:MAG: hypothetical protein JRJ38_19425 [Deltaproteobacteria bacterium]|nr:hypothetical protein [Deltaproteobacteria bacterium]